MEFTDRTEAGRALAERLSFPHGHRILVLGLPRGGVPVAAEVARALRAPLDVLVVRKLGVPGDEELAFGAIAEGGVVTRNEEIIAECGLTPEGEQRVVRKEEAGLERRRRAYRGSEALPSMEGLTVVLVDDGIATGATMSAAVRAAKAGKAARVVVAAPVASLDAVVHLRGEADEVVVLRTPLPFRGVGAWYRRFDQTADSEVLAALGRGSGDERRGERHGTDAERVRAAAHPLRGRKDDYDALLELACDARFVLLGEATHGTHEFYVERARITRRLVEEKGFSAVAVEADWPDAARVHRYVRGGGGEDRDARSALSGFTRFPRWMWANRETAAFVDWLKSHNARGGSPAGFYGLDLYSMHASMEAVLRYLAGVDPEAAKRARERYACFERFDHDSEAYGLAATTDPSRSCEEAAAQQLVEMHRAGAFASRGDPGFDPVAEEELFFARQNAMLVRDSERYYRALFAGRVSTWNLRDTHMADTLFALADHLKERGLPDKVVVWAHNSHLGDARATDSRRTGEHNLGQLVRERTSGGESLLVGFTTHRGFVTAADDWGEPGRRKRVREALPGSVEALFHESGVPRFLLVPGRDPVLRARLSRERLQRAIGVVYLPESERASHYFDARPSEQFDALIHFDETTAVRPLEPDGPTDDRDAPDTYPFAI